MIRESLKLFQSLFQQKKDKTLDNDVREILPVIPYSGKGGTICRVVETPKCFYKFLYDANGEVNPLGIPVPKKKNKNLKLLINDWCKDLQYYLDTFQSKYLECEKSLDKQVLTDKQFYALAIVTALATVASVPFLFSTTLAGVIFGTISGFSLYMVLETHKRDIQRVKMRDQFKNNYKKYQRILMEYSSGNSIVKEFVKGTNYTKIETVDKSNVIDLPKVKVLVRDDIKEAA